MFKDILPGEPRQPESSARYNAVNRLLKSREIGVETVASPPASDAVVIAGFNDSGGTIFCGSPVKVEAPGDLEDWEFEVWSISGYRIAPAADDSGLWGIAAENISSGSYGSVIVHGMAVAKMPPAGNGGYLIPKDGAFVSSLEAGRGRILKSSGGWAAVYLADIAAPVDQSYNGYFKIILTENNIIKVVDGATYDPASGTSADSVCRVNNRIFGVPAADLGVAASAPNVIYLEFDVENNTVTAKLGGSSLPQDTQFFTYYQLGRIIRPNNSDSFQVVQDHCSGVPQLWWSFICQ